MTDSHAHADARDEGLPDTDRLRQVVLEYYQDVYRYAYRLAGTVSDAEDLTQQTFLTAHRKLGQLKEAQRLKPWLFAVLRSVFLKSHRRQRPLTGIELAVDAIPDTVPGEDDIDRELLQTALDELPESYRVVLVMFYFEGLSYQEIAENLDIPNGTVMSRLSRAKGKLRQRLLVRQQADSGDQQHPTMMTAIDTSAKSAALNPELFRPSW